MSSCHTSTGGGGASNANVARDKNINYQEFSDEAVIKGYDEGFAYIGDGKETVNFFKENSNYEQLIRGMTSAEREAFEEWTAGRWMGGQMYEQFSSLSEWRQHMIRSYDKILDQAELKKGITVTRRSTAELIFGKGKRTATLEELQAMEGKSVLCKGCLSTGAAADGLLIGASSKSKSIEYSIKIPPGKGRGMWVGDKRINPGWGPKQREFMTNRDAIYKIGKTVYDAKKDVFRVEITMTDLAAHDYS